MNIFTAARKVGDVESAALQSIHAQHYFRDEDPHADAAAEHAMEQLCLAARELVRAVDAMPECDQPIGWDRVGVAS